MFQETERRLVELHRGHTCETWQLLLEDAAAAAVNRTTYREYLLRRGTVQTVPGGHQFYADTTGEPDAFHLDTDHHSGPGCAVCEDSWCDMCSPDVYKEQCPG